MKTKNVIMAIVICILSALSIVFAVLGRSETQVITTETTAEIVETTPIQTEEIDLNQTDTLPSDIINEDINNLELSTTTNYESTSTEIEQDPTQA